MDAVLDSQRANALGVRKEMIHYGMTKTAQLAVPRGVAESVAGTGVTVNAVMPEPTRSEILQNWLEPMAKQTSKSLEDVEQDFLRANRPTSIIKRFASNEEVANMVVYVWSQQAPATTGAALRVDGSVVRFVG